MQGLNQVRKALQKIARWHGEFPNSGRTWEDGTPMPYGVAFGSNGERDYMRLVALDALADLQAQQAPSDPVATFSDVNSWLLSLPKDERRHLNTIGKWELADKVWKAATESARPDTSQCDMHTLQCVHDAALEQAAKAIDASRLDQRSMFAALVRSLIGQPPTQGEGQ